MMIFQPFITSKELGSSIVPAYLESISRLKKEDSHLLSYHEAGEIALAACSAIDGGAIAAEVFDIRGLYMQKLELCREDNDRFFLFGHRRIFLLLITEQIYRSFQKVLQCYPRSLPAALSSCRQTIDINMGISIGQYNRYNKAIKR